MEKDIYNKFATNQRGKLSAFIAAFAARVGFDSLGLLFLVKVSQTYIKL